MRTKSGFFFRKVILDFQTVRMASGCLTSQYRYISLAMTKVKSICLKGCNAGSVCFLMDTARTLFDTRHGHLERFHKEKALLDVFVSLCFCIY